MIEPPPPARGFRQYSLSQLAERKMRQLGASASTGAPSTSSRSRPSCARRTSAAGCTTRCPSSRPTRRPRAYQYRRRAPRRRPRSRRRPRAPLPRAAGAGAAPGTGGGPTVVIARSGDFVFGGFASDGWRADGAPFGGPRCFLFSLTLDLKIPFQGRRTDPDDAALAAAQQRADEQPPDAASGAREVLDCLRASEDGGLCFGARDLVLLAGGEAAARGCQLLSPRVELQHRPPARLARGRVPARRSAHARADALEVWRVDPR